MAQARRMTESKQTVPHFYLSRDIDMTAAVALQKSSGLPLTAIIVRALVKALQAEPAVNMHFQKDALQKPAEIGINIAIDTEEGLVAPLLGNLEKLGLDETAANLKSLAQRARDRKLEKPDLQAGSMTLSNLGMFGIHSFSAIINPPQVAILAVGSIRPLQLKMEAGAVPAMTATLSCDHRALDGATGARFLQAVQVAIAEL
jgi:pyruvate dehydrogenase E2 component (dihydrolipoamide acetyltransferase)